LIALDPAVDTAVSPVDPHRLHKAADKLDNVEVLTISMDLPFAQGRWCAAEGVENLDLFSDHRDADVGKKYGTLIKELRLKTRAVFVVDENDKVVHAEYVPEVTTYPDFDAALQAAKQA